MAQKKGFGVGRSATRSAQPDSFLSTGLRADPRCHRSGNSAPGERLPSTRSLASQLSTARATIDLAYSLLSAEGYILSRGAGGTFVAPALSGLVKVPVTKGPSPPRSTPETAGENWQLLPFQMGLPALDAFPGKLWARLASRQARSLPLHAMSAPDPTDMRLYGLR